MVNLGNSWDDILKNEFQKDYYKKLRHFLAQEYKTQTIYPPMEEIFNGLKLTDYKDVKVVILGQDPYHGKNQAHGLAFSVSKDVSIPPSLLNIYKELKSDIGFEIPNHGNLLNWANNGVLLLNAVLTVRQAQPNSHKGKGWEVFTDNIISIINQREDPVVFMLWGANARKKKALITNDRHLILESVHPSPLSAYGGFLGCKHFSQAQEFLKKYGKDLDWTI